MVSRPRQSVKRLVTYSLMFPWRLPLVQRYRFKVCKKQKKRPALRPCSVKSLDWRKGEQDDAREAAIENVEKQQKRPALQPCSVKRLNGTKGEQDHVREAAIQNVQKDKTIPTENAMKINVVLPELPGIPLVPSHHSRKSGIIFIFEKASLVPAFVGKTYRILNPDDHASFMRRKKMNPYNYRPEIIHLALLEVIDSTLYKAGRVQAIYVKTEEGVLIKIEPHTQIPRTFGSFCAMMLELLQKFSVKAKGKREKLLRLIENPVTQHLPINCFRIGLTFSSKKLVCLEDYVGAISDDVNLVFVVGAMAHGKVDCNYADDVISVSEFPLSAACCVRKICCAMEEKWNIL